MANVGLVRHRGLEFPILPGVDNPDGTKGRIRVGIACCGCEAADAIQSGNGGVSQEWSIKRFKQKGWTVGKDRRHDVCPACTQLLGSAKGARLRHTLRGMAAMVKSGKRPDIRDVDRENRDDLLKVLDLTPEVATTPTEEPVKPVMPFTPKIVSDEPRQMGRDDRRLVFEKLNDAYVDEKVGYSDGWSDKRVAEELGCPQKWVETVREEMFGPIKTNDEALRLVAELAQASADAFQLGAEIKDLEVQIREGIQKLRDKQQVLSDAVNRLNKVARTVEKLY